MFQWVRFVMLEFRGVYFALLATLLASPIVWGTLVTAILLIGIFPISGIAVILWNLAVIWAARFTVYGYGRLYASTIVTGYMVIGIGHVVWLSLTTTIGVETLVRVVFELFAPGLAAILVVVAFGSLNRFVLTIGWITYFTLYVII